MPNQVAFDAIEVLYNFANSRPMNTGTQTGLCQPLIGPSESPFQMAKTRTDQTFPPGKTYQAHSGWSFADDFYYRIHVYPARLEVGNLTEQIVFDIELFNAFLQAVSLNAVTSYNNDGLDLVVGSLPRSILAMTSIVLPLTVSMLGPPIIDGRFVFDFSLGPDLTMLITGNRIVTFAISPDWSRTVSEKLSFWTQILESRDGSEQRIIMRVIPKWSFKYTFLEGHESLNLIDSLLYGWGARSYAVPLWTHKSRVSVPVYAGALEIPCDTLGRPFVEGGLCVLWRNPLTCETLEVANIFPNKLTLARPISQEYASGFIMPALLCHLVEETTKITALTSDLLEGEVEFEPDEWQDITPVEISDKYNGLMILPFKHDFKSGRSRTVDRRILYYDTGMGKYSRVDRRGYPMDVIQIDDIFLTSRAEIRRFKGFLMTVFGQAKPFYLMLNEDQLKVSRNLEYGSNMLYITNLSYGLLESHLDNRKTLFIKTKDERYIVNVTSYIGTEVGDIILLLDTSWPRAIPKEEVAQIGFLVKARLNHDEFEINYTADTLARTSISIKGVLS
jgi:hypothetical protein